MFNTLTNEIDNIISSVIELCWFMRGSIGYEEMMRRTPGERQRVSEFISKRLEKLKDVQYPVY